MPEAKYYLPIKGKEIPIIVRNYRNSYTVKMYFKGNILNISKPARMKQNEFWQLMKKNEETIYSQYEKINQKENSQIKHWYTGEEMLYQGEKYHILVKEETKIEPKLTLAAETKKEVKIEIEEKEKRIQIILSPDLSMISEEERKQLIDRKIKTILQRKTKELLNQKLPYWSKTTKITYKSFAVRDATSKFGSCKPQKRTLQFSNRLIMLPEDKIEAIIVHELCHMIHANHGKEFYQLVESFYPNYQEIDLWLKENSKEIMI